MASLVAHDCGYPLSRYTCRATRVAADFLDFIAFCRCSTSVALHPLKILVSHLPPLFPGGVAPKFGSEKVSRYTGVVAATVAGVALHCATKMARPPAKNSASGMRTQRIFIGLITIEHFQTMGKLGNIRYMPVSL